ncbi:hypothetical protein KFK09_016910 [Dendrobium nobile]|uniref:Uncharacterized protein n=1 Tax=Dendrobium nobile TaxID=94219 RepID=A0A8T3B610_DENNO|nr:hypothetical protein KFK09_016910 [Dendrobium nobile]
MHSFIGCLPNFILGHHTITYLNFQKYVNFSNFLIKFLFLLSKNNENFALVKLSLHKLFMRYRDLEILNILNIFLKLYTYSFGIYVFLVK